MSDSVQPHRWQPTRLPGPWDSPGKNTRVGCHFLLQCMKAKSENEVAQSCPTLSDPMECSPPGSSVHGIFQARVLEWGATAFSSPPPGVLPNSGIKFMSVYVSCIGRWDLDQLCPTISDPMDCSPPGSSVHRVFQARALEGGAIAFSDSSLALG